MNATSSQPVTRGSFLRAFFVLGMIVAAGLVAIFFLLGQKPFEKTATQLAMPCGLIWLTLLGITLPLMRGGHDKAAFFAFACWLGFSLAGNGFVSNYVAQQIERPFIDIRPLEQEPFDFVVVLGGGGKEGANERMQGNTSGDRLILGAQLYHAGVAPKIICTGRRIEELSTREFGPADHSAAVLRGLGVPSDVIGLMGGRTTSEEMDVLREMFADNDKRVGVVTSAWHLPRALRLAEANGLKLIPLPADFLSGPTSAPKPGQVILNSIPSAPSLMVTTSVIKEWLAGLVRR